MRGGEVFFAQSAVGALDVFEHFLLFVGTGVVAPATVGDVEAEGAI